MIEDDKALVERLRDEDEGGWVLTLCGEAADRIEVLSAENERLTYNGIHSCHDECERPLCVAQRENERLQTQYDEMGNNMLKHIGNSAEEIVRLELENDGLKADNERLREAIKDVSAIWRRHKYSGDFDLWLNAHISAALGETK